MANHQNALQQAPEFTHAAPMATILPSNTAMPMACDACDQDNTYSIGFLRRLPKLTCKHCGDHRQFSPFELTLIENTLKNMGYFLTKSA